MRLLTFLLTTSAAVGAFAAARRLMADADVIERLPEPAQAAATAARARLIAVREVLAEGFRQGRVERAGAEQEFMDEYRRLAHR